MHYRMLGCWAFTTSKVLSAGQAKLPLSQITMFSGGMYCSTRRITSPISAALLWQGITTPTEQEYSRQCQQYNGTNGKEQNTQ
jgi:hypothetical protein